MTTIADVEAAIKVAQAHPLSESRDLIDWTMRQKGDYALVALHANSLRNATTWILQARETEIQRGVDAGWARPAELIHQLIEETVDSRPCPRCSSAPREACTERNRRTGELVPRDVVHPERLTAPVAVVEVFP